MPNGDIVSGCSDGIVRVFSESNERWASGADLKEYDDKVASQALPTQQVGDVKKTDLPGPEVLIYPGMSDINVYALCVRSMLFIGKKEGEVKMVRNGDTVEAHQVDHNCDNE